MWQLFLGYNIKSTGKKNKNRQIGTTSNLKSCVHQRSQATE